MTVWVVVWVVLMMFWFFGCAFCTYNQPTPNWPAFGACCFIPWLCVLILGLIVFGALSPGVVVVR